MQQPRVPEQSFPVDIQDLREDELSHDLPCDPGQKSDRLTSHQHPGGIKPALGQTGKTVGVKGEVHDRSSCGAPPFPAPRPVRDGRRFSGCLAAMKTFLPLSVGKPYTRTDEASQEKTPSMTSRPVSPLYRAGQRLCGNGGRHYIRQRPGFRLTSAYPRFSGATWPYRQRRHERRRAHERCYRISFPETGRENLMPLPWKPHAGEHDRPGGP